MLDSFYRIRDWQTESSEYADKMLRESKGIKKWALVLNKTKRAHFRNIGQDVHGLGTERFQRMVEFQNAVFGEGVTLYIGVNDRDADEALFAPVHELVKRKYSCICAACRSGNKDKCQNEPGGMTYFPVSTFKPFSQFDNKQVIIQTQRSVTEPEQLGLF